MINVKSLIARGLLVLACGTTAFTVNTMASTTAHATTASTVAMLRPAFEAAGQLRPDWTARTCAAFARWQHKPTEARLERVMRDSTRVPWNALGGDVWTWYGAERAIQHDKPGQKLGDEQRESVAEQYVGEDCFGGA